MENTEIRNKGSKLIVCFDDKAKGKAPQTFDERDDAKLKELNEKGFGIFETANSFFATPEQFKASGAKTKRRKEFLSNINEVFADLDVCKDTDSLPEDEREERKRHLKEAINSYCPASTYVITKNGLQPRWWLEEERVDEQTQEKYVNVINGIIEWSKGHGSSGDPVKDVTRVLRIPGYNHHKSDPYLVTQEKGNEKFYTLDELKNFFWYESISKIQPKQNNELTTDLNNLDIRQVVIDVWKEKGQMAEFDNDGHLIIDGTMTATFKGSKGDGNYIATSSSDYPAKGNAVTYTAETLKISSKEAYKWLSNKYE